MKNKKVLSLIFFLIFVLWVAPKLLYFFSPEYKISNTIKLLQLNTFTNENISLPEEDIKDFKSILNYIIEHELTNTEFIVLPGMIIKDVNGEKKEGFMTNVEAFKYGTNGQLLEHHYGKLFFETKRGNLLFWEVADMEIITDIKKD